MTKVITRFPPSPTGLFHIGSARTALFNYLFAAGSGGAMYLRFEDTDKERSKKEYENDIVDGLAWLGISYTKSEIFRQSERTEVYRKHLKTLIDKGAAYEAEASTDNPDKKVVRFKNPNVRITFSDLVRGEVSFDTAELKDFVIARNVHEPLYHLAVVIDDYEMGITHVIRGEDHISNTQRQILILEALDFPRPQYAHIPLILAPDRTKLSKRHGAVSINEYREEGYLPEAMVNYLALLGWNPGGAQEIFTLPELVEKFDIEQIHKSGAIFDVEKLKWFNDEHRKRMPPSAQIEYKLKAVSGIQKALESRGIPFDRNLIVNMLSNPNSMAPVISEFVERATAGEYDFLTNPALKTALISQKGTAPAEARQHLEHVRGLLSGTSDESFNDSGRLKDIVWNYATEKGRGAVLWPLRYALSGKERSPDPFVIASIIGKKETLKRIESAITRLNTV